MLCRVFLPHYRLDTNSDYDALVNDNQPTVLTDSAIEENHNECSLPKSVPLMSSKETMKCRKVRKVLRYYTPNRHKCPEKYAHHLLMLYYPFRNEGTDLATSKSFSLKLNEQSVIDVVNRNRAIFEPDSELLELALRNYRMI